MKGYVYILEVKDIVLPVCKIGMTERTPQERCTEINRSSTGDFIWEVAYSVFVSDCRGFEALVHTKLGPLRQKKREFFNISADDANTAMISILESQQEIVELIPEETDPVRSVGTAKRNTSTTSTFRKIDSYYADLLQMFASVLNVKGRPFGQLNRPVFGISDGNRGVQWNMTIRPDIDDVRIGVNLEGSATTGRWLIADFLQSNPDITALASSVKNPHQVKIGILRDAWQGPARLTIKEKYIGGREFSLGELEGQVWRSILDEGLSCLDEDQNYRGRKKSQPVTLNSDGRILQKDVSPHLIIWKNLLNDGDVEGRIRTTIAELAPVRDWVIDACDKGERT
jgi:hypothetical protein